MSEKSKIRRARREARQERQAKEVIMWIAVALVIIAILCIGYYALN